MKLIYICSPLRGDYENNRNRAIEYCREVVKEGNKPVCPHIYYTQFLDDSKPDERDLGMQFGLEDLIGCDKIYVYGEPSEGMKKEIALAEQMGIEIVGKERLK